MANHDRRRVLEWLFTDPMAAVDTEVASTMYSPDVVGAVVMGVGVGCQLLAAGAVDDVEPGAGGMTVDHDRVASYDSV